MKKENSKLKDIFEEIRDWIEWNVYPVVILSITALLISIASATLSISILILYFTTH